MTDTTSQLSGFSFKENENATQGQTFDTQNVFDALKYNEQGLIPAIAQQYDTKEVLMMAWMNAESLQETVKEGRVCYFSRSRQNLWRKGESSGQVQIFKELRMDCDGDTLLLLVDQTGPACHTGRRNCFYLALDQNGEGASSGASKSAITVTDAPIIDPKELYKK
ncbi:MAG: phosphoribosyl-AMP cyclohydrolase [Pseudomonadales bacterium]|nr:phosphoribosyl-AMP cyclohydrolase [Pseudomonadales bacterium]